MLHITDEMLIKMLKTQQVGTRLSLLKAFVDAKSSKFFGIYSLFVKSFWPV